MRLGGKGLGRGPRVICAAAIAAFAGWAALAQAAVPSPRPLSSSLLVAPAGADAASTASATTIFVLAGTPAPNSLTASSDSDGRLVLNSPQGIVEPDGTKADCTQDSPTQVSCRPGFIGAIAGDLAAGEDEFEAQATLETLIGVALVSEERPLAGGPGRDRIGGGRGGDLLDGGAGDDEVFGLGGADLLRGRAGRDALSGGRAADALFGGAGADRLNGGGARDRCNGGGGLDSAKSCNVTRKIP